MEIGYIINMKTIYYIYHIEGIKIGVSINPEKRTLDQGFTSYQILETHTNIYEVSKREKQLQRQYGYKVDGSDYWRAIEQRKVGAKSKSDKKRIASQENIKKATAAAVLAGAPSKAGKANAIKERKCPYCQKEGKGPTMFRYHYENCKSKTTKTVIN